MLRVHKGGGLSVLRPGYTQRFLESVPGDKEMTFDLSVILQMVTWAYPGREEGVPTFQGDKVSLW